MEIYLYNTAVIIYLFVDNSFYMHKIFTKRKKRLNINIITNRAI